MSHLSRTLRSVVVLGTASLSLSACTTTRDSVDLAQPSAPVAAAASGLNISKGRIARIDSFLQQYVDEGRLAGAVALVLQDGKPVYEGVFGSQDKEAGDRMRSDSIFRIASQTKALTSAATLILLEEGKLTLTTPVSQFIPEYANGQVALEKDGASEIIPAKRAITIRDLLTHTSGYSYGMEARVAALYEAKRLGPAAGHGWYTADKAEPICDTMARLGTLPAVAQPGESYVYGYSTDILGCVVERASGVTLERFLQTRIFDPLEMRDTHFFLPEQKRSRLATVYGSDANGKAVRAPEGAKGQGHYVEGPRRNFSGGAGLLSTASDYARFLEMIRNDGMWNGKRILGPRAVELMRTNQSGSLHSSTGLGYGYGFQTVDRYGANGLEGLGGFGWGGAYGSIYRVDPEAKLTSVLMIQLMPNSTDAREKFLTLVYQALE
jgi:CubicO group peptidase (beta-lactamase class C family)